MTPILLSHAFSHSQCLMSHNVLQCRSYSLKKTSVNVMLECRDDVDFEADASALSLSLCLSLSLDTIRYDTQMGQKANFEIIHI